MSGVRGRVGRKPLPVEEHLAKGTWRKDWHGPVVVPEVTPEAPVPRVRAPKHLRPDTRRWFYSVVRGWKLDEHHRMLLQQAAECWDRCEAARDAIAASGLTVKSARGGPPSIRSSGSRTRTA
jgi:hypothetical protein